MSGPEPPEPHSDEPYPQAYSAPESEQFTSGPYVPADPGLYDFDSYTGPDDHDDTPPPRWPWVVGVTAIIAAIALVVSVALLVARTETTEAPTPSSTAVPSPPGWNEIPTTTTTSPPPPTGVEPEPPPETESTESSPSPTSEETTTTTEPPETTTTTTTTTPPAPRQITYRVDGIKSPGDIITVTYIDAFGNRNTQNNVPIPWSITLTPISASEVGSVEASSLFGFSRLNCEITSSDGKVLSRNANNLPRTSC